jgi:hypothetical protein
MMRDFACMAVTVVKRVVTSGRVVAVVMAEPVVFKCEWVSSCICRSASQRLLLPLLPLLLLLLLLAERTSNKPFGIVDSVPRVRRQIRESLIPHMPHAAKSVVDDGGKDGVPTLVGNYLHGTSHIYAYHTEGRS